MNRLWLRIGLVFIGIGFATQLAFTIAQVMASNHTIKHAIIEIRTRVALDIDYLGLGDPYTNQTANREGVTRYLTTLNRSIAKQYAITDLSVLSINSQPSESIRTQYSTSLLSLRLNTETISTYLSAGNGDVRISIALPATSQIVSFYWLGLVLAMVCAGLHGYRIASRMKRNVAERRSVPQAYLRIDLTKKQLVNVASGNHFDMQNKPLCFFTALVKYCIEHPEQELLHHKDVPDELLNRANKVFARLIELGHTKRKRPDFNANLEKTLSEIRAVLDAVFVDQEVQKSQFYPPRAQGEGSRSKQHSYALHQIDSEKVEFIGL